MNDLEVIKRARIYTEKLANGINPLDDSIIPETDIVNNVRISRCLFYVSDILKDVIEKQEKSEKRKTPKEDFAISFDEIQKFKFSDTPITISEISKRINELTENELMKKLSHKNITDWLMSIEMLKNEQRENGKNQKLPTESGKELGILTEVRTGLYGAYSVVLYNKSAQHFIVDNIESIIETLSKEKKEKN